jgi:hypothetical protein
MKCALLPTRAELFRRPWFLKVRQSERGFSRVEDILWLLVMSHRNRGLNAAA